MDPKKEREYADRIPDDEETERPDPYEETYRDGSPKNECWNEDQESRPITSRIRSVKSSARISQPSSVGCRPS